MDLKGNNLNISIGIFNNNITMNQNIVVFYYKRILRANT